MLRYIRIFVPIFIVQYAVDVTVMAADYQKSASRLHSLIAAEATTKHKANFVFSPHSILSVAAAVTQGAAGNTRIQLEKTVGGGDKIIKTPNFSNRSAEAIVDIANRIYVSNELRGNAVFEDFKNVCAIMQSSAEVADFSDVKRTAAKINKYISDTTRGHIKDLVSESSITQDTSLILVNALYFKARWAEQFSKEATFKGTFKALEDWHVREKTVTFMRKTFDRAPVMYYEDEDVKSVAVPYLGEGLFMYIIIPEDIFGFEVRMGEDPTMVDSIIGKVRASVESHGEEELTLTIPKFKLNAKDNELDLERHFTHLGAKDMFYPGLADFSGINDGRDLYVSSFLHQADIIVNEEGTEATAATVMNIMATSMPIPKEPLRVVVDSPFIYQVRHSEAVSWGVYEQADEDAILFSGRISDPSSAQ